MAIYEKRPRQYAGDYIYLKITKEGGKAARRALWRTVPAHLRALTWRHVRDWHLKQLFQLIIARREVRRQEQARQAAIRAREARREIHEQLSGGGREDWRSRTGRYSK